jgi:hypothetical protein
MRAIIAAGLIFASHPAPAASIFIESTSTDPVGQSIIYNLRNEIARSSIHKVVYSRNDAGFVINVITLKQHDGASSVYSATLLMPPFDNQGLDYYITGIVGFCGSSVTRDCGSGILASFDNDIAQVVSAMQSIFKKK